ncbi:MAG: PEGA domain-containing protein [Tannerella sp.]|nr:PEGA domain-containing protein [Tannerella sp.]
MKRYLLFMSMTVIAVLFSSCATIISGTSQPVNFNSEPQGAMVTIDGQPIGKTPVSAEIKRKTKSTVVFSKENYEEQAVNMKGNFNAVTLGNILLGGIVGLAVDFATGAAWKYDSNAYIQLTPSNGYISPRTNHNTSIIRKVVPATTGYEQKVAVLDPIGSDIPLDIMVIVREEISNAVVNTEGYTILEPEQINRVLGENKIRMDEKQIGALGNTMGADKVFVTNVTKLSNSYYVSCRLVDVATAQIEAKKTGTIAANGSNIDEVIANIMRTILK